MINNSQCKALDTFNMNLVAHMKDSNEIDALAGSNKANYTNKALGKAHSISITPAPSDNLQLHAPMGALLGLVAMAVGFFLASQPGGLGPMAQLLTISLVKSRYWKNFQQLCLAQPVKT